MALGYQCRTAALVKEEICIKPVHRRCKFVAAKEAWNVL